MCLRRVPIQLVEAALALVIALGTLLLWLAGPPPSSGVVFVGAVAAYTLGRQVLFPLRAEPRRTGHGRVLTMALSALVLAAAVAVFVLG